MARRKASERRTNDPDGLRGRILDATAACFQRDGYRGTNIRDVTRAAGTTSGALHHHFPTKKALGMAILAERVATAVETTWIARVRSAPSAVEGVLSVFDDVIAELDAKHRVEGCPLNNLAIELALVDDEFRQQIERIFAKWRRAIADKAKSDRRTGNEPSYDPNAWAQLSVAQFSGAMAMAKAAQSTKPLKVSARILRQLIGPTGVVQRSLT
jgi:TetR/AcrR family transcriptional regulator, transcriptional repressor for nem operon